MLLLIFIPIITALIIFLLKSEKINKLGILSIFFEVFLIYKLFIDVSSNGPQSLIVGGWSKLIGISLYIDFWSFIFLFVTIVAWFASSVYSLNKWAKDYKFYFFLNFLRGTFYGLIFSNDLFNVFIFIEIISVISAILVIYKKDGFSLRAGLYYLVFNSVGMSFYLLGLIIIYMRLGTLNIDYLAQMPLDQTTKIALGLIVTSLGVKSAFFPVYTWTWLPRAHMAAPSSISALLSSVLVKTGFIVLLKFFRVLPPGIFHQFLLIMGILKAISGILFALSQKDIKGILAFHTISQSGIILMGMSGMDKLYIGGVLHLINHSLFKGLLFLTVGVIIKRYGIRRVKNIRGLFKNMPGVSLALIIGILSITGFPYTNGFTSKYLIKTTFEGNLVLKNAMHLINLGTIISFIKLAHVLKGENKAAINYENSPSSIPLVFLSIITFFSGFVERYILKEYLNIVIKVKPYHFITYGIYILIGYLIYIKVVKKDIKPLKFLRHYQLGFRRANIILIIFVLLTMAFIY